MPKVSLSTEKGVQIFLNYVSRKRTIKPMTKRTKEKGKLNIPRVREIP